MRSRSIFRFVNFSLAAAVLFAGSSAGIPAADKVDYSAIVDENSNPVPHGPTAEDILYIRQLNDQKVSRGFEKPLPWLQPLEAQAFGKWTPGEYEPVLGPLVAWEPGSYLSLLTEFVAGVTADPDMNSFAFVIVRDAVQEASATAMLSGYGADMDRVKFVYYDLNTVWIRDYGPRYITQSGTPWIIDHTYNRVRPEDNLFPSWLSTNAVPFPQNETVNLMDLIHGGGNFHAFSNGKSFMSTLIYEENSSKTQTEIQGSINSSFNTDVTVYQRLPSGVDATGHIDMWFLPVADNKVIIGRFNSSVGTNGYTQTEAAAADMAAKGYTVYRVPSYNSGTGGTGGTHYTYTNAAIINKRVFVPYYGGTHAADDATAVSVFQTAMPGHTIVPVNCASIISAAGAIHCVMKHVYTAPTPFVEGLRPKAGDMVRAGESTPIKWVANDDDFDIAGVNIFLSTDGGLSYPYTIATGEPHDGYYTWTVPCMVSSRCRIMVEVDDGEGNTAQHVTGGDFSIGEPLGTPVVYTYSGIASPSSRHTAEDGEIDVGNSMIETGSFPARKGTGISGWTNWGEASSVEYSRLTGSDDRRYQGADPGNGDNAAMIFEFTVNEAPSTVQQMDVSVEIGRASSLYLGFAYLWNYSTGSYTVLGSQSGTADQVISATITSNPGDYIEPGTGQITVFVVNEDVSDWIRVDNISVTLRGPAAPIIEQHPVAQTADIGDPASFTVSACGSQPLSYQWKLDEVDIAGATGATYAIAFVQLSDAGDYTCIVTNTAGSSTSDAATLTVNNPIIPPAISAQPLSQTVNPGDPIHLFIGVTGTFPITYQWQKNHIDITGANDSTLDISPADEPDEAIYTCVASNAGGSVTSDDAVVTVNDPVVITVQPDDQTVNPGTAVSMIVTATGTDPLTFQWQKDGVDISGATSDALAIASVQESDEGSYACMVTNIVGSVLSNAAVITVNDPVVITDHPASQTVVIGDSITFTVAASGTPPFSFQWLKNSEPVAGAESDSYTINPVSREDEGTYSCVVTNAIGSVTSDEAFLEVEENEPRPVPAASATTLACTLATLLGLGFISIRSYKKRA